MKRTAILAGGAAVAIWSTGVFAQGRNFAGSWTVDMERTVAAMGGAGGFVGAGGGAGVRTRGSGAGDAGAVGGGFSGAGGGGGAVARVAGGAGGGGGMRSGGPGGPTTISLDANTFTVAIGETNTVYRTDGTSTSTESPRGQVVSKAAWQGDHLVIETTAPGGNGPVTSQVSWYLEGDALVRATSAPNPDGGDPIVRKTYYKKASGSE